jgi:photosystem II stability/assembly factor-like uncharacterized protein
MRSHSTLRNLLLSLALLLSTASLSAQDTPGDWRRLGPEGGSVFDLVAAPSDPRVLYAIVEGRVFRSRDGGASWADLGFLVGNDGSLAVDAVEPSKVYANAGVNLARSVTGGETWDYIAPAGRVNGVAAHPRRGGFVFVATEAGLFRSADSGTTWQALGAAQGLPQTYVAFGVFTDPYFPSRVFVSTGNARFERRRFFKSLDAGLTWQPTDGGDLRKAYPIRALATVPGLPKTLYATDGGLVYRSLDAGLTWKRRTFPIGAGFILNLTVVSTQPDVLYAQGSVGLFRSRNGGGTWEEITQGLPEDGAVNAIVLTPGGQGPSLLAAVSTVAIRRGGVFRSTDGGTSWSSTSQGILATTVTSIDVGGPGTLWIVANGVLFRSTDQGQTWSRIRPGPPPAGVFLPYIAQVLVDPADRSNVFIVWSNSEIRRSGDAGATWEAAGKAEEHSIVPAVVAIDPRTPSTLYAAGFRISKSTDRGTTWKVLDAGGHTDFIALAVAPSSPSTLYALGRRGRFLRSTDGGATWTAGSRIARNLVPSSLAVDPLLPKTVYVGSESGIYKTKDGGDTWSLFSNAFAGRPIFPLEISGSGLIYAGAPFDRLYAIRDGDNAWSALEGSGFWTYTALAFDPHDPCRIYVGAVGQSLLVFTKSGTAECP